MRRTCHFLLATMIVAAPMPVAAQVSVDFNALSGLGRANLPTPPPTAPTAVHRHHHGMRHLAARAEHRAGHGGPQHGGGTAVAAATHAPAGPETIEHPANLGPSFASLPALPGVAPPVPEPPPVLPAAGVTKAPAPKPVETAIATPKLTAKPEAPRPVPPQLALPGAVPPPPPIPGRLADATPAPPAAEPAPQPAAPNALPKGADRLTLPFFVQESDLPPAENAMLRDFAQRYGAYAQYIVRAFASAPAGDDDPSTPRRIALERAQSVASALRDSGVPPDRLRLLALGSAGGTPADRVEVIAMPPSSGHTDPQSSP